jgi:hypothetical protein
VRLESGWKSASFRRSLGKSLETQRPSSNIDQNDSVDLASLGNFRDMPTIAIGSRPESALNAILLRAWPCDLEESGTMD